MKTNSLSTFIIILLGVMLLFSGCEKDDLVFPQAFGNDALNIDESPITPYERNIGKAYAFDELDPAQMHIVNDIMINGVNQNRNSLHSSMAEYSSEVSQNQYAGLEGDLIRLNGKGSGFCPIFGVCKTAIDIYFDKRKQHATGFITYTFNDESSLVLQLKTREPVTCDDNEGFKMEFASIIKDGTNQFEHCFVKGISTLYCSKSILECGSVPLRAKLISNCHVIP
jgi:hypothetical protein